MLSVKATIYEVQPATAPGQPPPRPKEVPPPLEVTADSHDALKEVAKIALTRRGYSVRNVSWGPGAKPGDPDRLVVYVEKKPKESTDAP